MPTQTAGAARTRKVISGLPNSDFVRLSGTESSSREGRRASRVTPANSTPATAEEKGGVNEGRFRWKNAGFRAVGLMIDAKAVVVPVAACLHRRSLGGALCFSMNC